MKYPFSTYQMNVEGHVFWVAESAALKGCVGQGDTIDEALSELQTNEECWLETAAEMGIPIPPIAVVEQPKYSGKMTLRISPFTHEQASKVAVSQGISLNQFINDAVVNYIASITSKEEKVTVIKTITQDEYEGAKAKISYPKFAKVTTGDFKFN